MAKTFKVRAPLPNFNGTVAEVYFRDGEAEITTDNDLGRAAYAFFDRNGYRMDLVEDTDSSKADTKDSGTGSASDDDTFEPGEHTVTDVLTYLDTADRDEAVRVLDAEAAGQARKGISSERETILASKEGQA